MKLPLPIIDTIDFIQNQKAPDYLLEAYIHPDFYAVKAYLGSNSKTGPDYPFVSL